MVSQKSSMPVVLGAAAFAMICNASPSFAKLPGLRVPTQSQSPSASQGSAAKDAIQVKVSGPGLRPSRIDNKPVYRNSTPADTSQKSLYRPEALWYDLRCYADASGFTYTVNPSGFAQYTYMFTDAQIQGYLDPWGQDVGLCAVPATDRAKKFILVG